MNEGAFKDKGIPNSVRSESYDAVVITSYSDNYMVKGYAFQSSLVLTIPTGKSYFLFDTINVDDTSMIFSAPIAFGATDGPVVVTFNYAHNYTGGTPLRTFNRNFMSANLPGAILTQGATGTNEGSVNTGHLIGVSAGGVASGGGRSGGADAVILPQGANFLIVVDNQSGGSVQFDYDFRWYEIPLHV